MNKTNSELLKSSECHRGKTGKERGREAHVEGVGEQGVTVGLNFKLSIQRRK